MRNRTALLLLLALPLMAIDTQYPDQVLSKHWRADEIVPDGTECLTATDQQINSGPIIRTMRCDDDDASIIEGSWRMPVGWDGGPLIFELHYIQTADDQGSFSADVSAQCCDTREGIPQSGYGTEVAIDDGSVTGNSAIDTVTTAAVTPSGTCAGGDHVFWKIALDADATTTSMAKDGTFHVIGVTMKYEWGSDDDETIATNTGYDFSADANCLGAWLVFSDGTEASSELNVCDATSGSYDVAWQGAAWAAGTAPAGSPTGYDSVDITASADEYFSATDAAGELDAFEAAEFTLACWVNKDLSVATEIFMSKDDVTAWEMASPNDDRFRAEVEDAQEQSAADVLAVGDWHHVSLRRSNATATTEIAVDGDEACSSTCSAASAPTGNTASLVIGASQLGGADFDGQLMECVYLDRALTDLERAELFLCGLEGTADGTARDLAFGGATCDDIDDACCN